MTNETYNYIKKQLEGVHDRVQNAPVSHCAGAEAALIAIEKLNMAVQDLLKATKEGNK